MYGIFAYIYHILPLKTTIHVGKYASPMDGMGMMLLIYCYHLLRYMKGWWTVTKPWQRLKLAAGNRWESLK